MSGVSLRSPAHTLRTSGAIRRPNARERSQSRKRRTVDAEGLVTQQLFRSGLLDDRLEQIPGEIQLRQQPAANQVEHLQAPFPD